MKVSIGRGLFAITESSTEDVVVLFDRPLLIPRNPSKRFK